MLRWVGQIVQLNCIDLFISGKGDTGKKLHPRMEEVIIARVTLESLVNKCPYEIGDDRRQYLDSVSRRIKRGEMSYAAIVEDRVVAYAWVKRNDVVYISEVDSTPHIEPSGDKVVVRNCWTHEAYRGKGLYTCLLQYIIEEFTQDIKVIYCRCSNVQSRAGIMKLFQPYKRIYQLKLFGLSIWRT